MEIKLELTKLESRQLDKICRRTVFNLIGYLNDNEEIPREVFEKVFKQNVKDIKG